MIKKDVQLVMMDPMARLFHINDCGILEMRQATVFLRR